MATPRTSRPRRATIDPRARQATESWSRISSTGAALVALVLVAYWPAMGAGFIWDDDSYVTGNATLHAADGLRRIWLELGATPQYYPLVHSTFWGEYRLWGLDPAGFHIVNIALHACSALFAWRLLQALHVPGAWLAAAIFAVHPVEVESVAWITERKNVLSLALALASMLAWFRFSPIEEGDGESADARALNGGYRWVWYAVALILFTCALLSKTVVASVPAVVLVICWWKHGRIGVRDAEPLAPFFASAMGLGLVTAWMERHVVGATGEEWSFTGTDRVLIAGRAVWFYAAKLLWPTRLAFFYPRWTIDRAALWEYLFPAAAVLIVASLVLAWRRLGRGPLAAAMIFGGVLLPALGFFDVFPMRFSFVADHFQYHASLALITLLAAGAATLASGFGAIGQKLVAVWAVVLLATFSAATWHRATIFHDVESLYRDTIAKNPTGPTAYANLAVYLESVERYDEALALARQAVALGPAEATAHNTLGTCLLRIAGPAHDGDQIEAGIAEFATALRLLPNFVDAHVNMAVALSAAGRQQEARQHLEAALEKNPTHADAHYELGRLFFGEGQLPQAAEEFQHAATLRPGFARALNNLGVVWMNLGETEKAIDFFERAVQAKPDYAEATANLRKARQIQNGYSAP